MNPGMLRIHVISPLPDDLSPDRWRLTADEIKRASSFRHADDASRWAFCRSTLRRTLGELLGHAPNDVPVATRENGKPCLSRPFDYLHFNLSHCAELALIAIGMDGPVGIDVEPSARAKDLLGCEDSFCHPDEIAELPASENERATRLLELWTAKEALLKALGTGLAHPPESIRLHLDGAKIRVSAETLPPGLENHAISRLGQDLPRGFTAAVCHPRVSEVFQIVPPLGSTTRVAPAKLTGAESRSNA